MFRSSKNMGLNMIRNMYSGDCAAPPALSILSTSSQAYRPGLTPSAPPALRLSETQNSGRMAQPLNLSLSTHRVDHSFLLSWLVVFRLRRKGGIPMRCPWHNRRCAARRDAGRKQSALSKSAISQIKIHSRVAWAKKMWYAFSVCVQKQIICRPGGQIMDL